MTTTVSFLVLLTDLQVEIGWCNIFGQPKCTLQPCNVWAETSTQIAQTLAQKVPESLIHRVVKRAKMSLTAKTDKTAKIA